MERKSYAADFKLKVVLESMQRETTLEQVCQKFGVSRSMVHLSPEGLLVALGVPLEVQ
jgi:transposase-like protein